jgi:hypothetical protein
MVMIFIVIITILGMGILYLGGLERLSANQRLQREQAFYLAEAGLQRAWAHLQSNPSWVPENTPIALGNGTFQLSENVQGNTVILTSTGTVGSESQTVSMILLSSGAGGTTHGSFSFGLFGSQSATLYNNALIDSYDSTLGPYGGANVGQAGHTSSKGTITLYNNATIKGNAYVSGPPQNIILGNNAVITGTKNANYSFDDPWNNLNNYPVVIPSELSSLPYPVQGDPRITGSYTISNGVLTIGINAHATISGGDFRFKSIILSNNSTLTVSNVSDSARFYIEQQVNLSNNSTFFSSATVVFYLGTNCQMLLANNSLLNNQSGNPSQFRIYSASSYPLTFVNNSQALSAVIYAPKSNVTLANNAQFFGGIVAKNLTLAQNAEVHYDVSLTNTVLPDDPGVVQGAPQPPSFIRWTKPGWQNQFQ